jgi:hypothetical protein
MNAEEVIRHITGYTPDEIRNMDDDALWELISTVRDEGYQAGYDEAY